MIEPAMPLTDPQLRLKQLRAEVEAIRAHARLLFDGEATGIQVAAAISEATERFLIHLFRETLNRVAPGHAERIERNVAMVAVGGTGRGELCPYSDVDLLFLVRPSERQAVGDCLSEVVRQYWDAGLRLGQAVRTVADTVALARQEIDVSTALVEARLLWGSRSLHEHLMVLFQKKLIRSRTSAFIDECVAARAKERSEFGSAVKQLEPDVKRSPGGLRDLHLMRWVGFARYGASDVESLRLLGALSREEARTLLTAYDYVKRVRIDLHFSSGRCQDVLMRDEQLRIAEERRIEGSIAQRPVERFMQTYFRHSTAIAELTERFLTLHRPRSIFLRILHSLATHRSDGIYVVGNDTIDVLPRFRKLVVANLEGILKFYKAAALYRAGPAPQFAQRIREATAHLSGECSPQSAQLFLEILACHGNLGTLLRSMFRTGVLEIVVPPMAHARCLLQFNQYHSYTVDEHTLRAIEALEGLERDRGPLGDAYRSIRKKQVVHLAMLLHDLGKGFQEDHSDVGRAIADRVAARLLMSDEDRDRLMFLVHKHLLMAHQSFRRDTTEPATIVEFSREVGSAESLRMLYVLTAADIMAVGPGVWTEWKADLLAEMYNRTLVLLSGEDATADQDARLAMIKEQVLKLSRHPAAQAEETARPSAVLDRFPSHYLNTTPPDRIASDVVAIERHTAGRLLVDGVFDAETRTLDFRIIAHENDVTGCFHKATGVLTANRLEIISAQISTTSDGFVVDRFRVQDGDFAGDVPVERIEAIAESMRNILSGLTPVEELFRRHRRFSGGARNQPVSDLPARVVIDNTSSERFTVIDVFSHDRPGLLYTIARKIFELDLSVVRAKIATHLDQIVDVFYITDCSGSKILDPERLKAIQSRLFSTLEEFEHCERLQFAS